MNSDLPIDRKYALTIEEASELTSIGTKKLYELVSSNRSAPFVLRVGRKTLIKREAFQRYLEKTNDL